jgi:hypothetical protein
MFDIRAKFTEKSHPAGAREPQNTYSQPMSYENGQNEALKLAKATIGDYLRG